MSNTERPQYEQCQTCLGSGVITELENMQKCPTCHGEGWFRNEEELSPGNTERPPQDVKRPGRPTAESYCQGKPFIVLDNYSRALEAYADAEHTARVELRNRLRRCSEDLGRMTDKVTELESEIKRLTGMPGHKLSIGYLTELKQENAELKAERERDELRDDLEESNNTISTLGFDRAKDRITELEGALRATKVALMNSPAITDTVWATEDKGELCTLYDLVDNALGPDTAIGEKP